MKEKIITMAVAIRETFENKGIKNTVSYTENLKEKSLYSEITLDTLELLEDFAYDIYVPKVGYFKVSPVSFEDKPKRLFGKVAIITGGAQGFGLGIAKEMAKQGAFIAIADINYPAAKESACEINNLLNDEKAVAVKVDVTDENSVKEMFYETILAFGGIDIFVNNAGIVRAGSIDELSLDNFELVTNVNYTAYFLGVKYASIIMKTEYKYNPQKYFDIIQINSKSGLEGSNKNFAYSGSKFGGIGLTQSFALELAPFNIKVNSICPGNYLDGPLWSDPENGLFTQYLNAEKVPGAKTVADVKKFYEAKVPQNRGCLPLDVAKAIFYCVEQEYETGQAIPVTGGQLMLS